MNMNSPEFIRVETPHGAQIIATKTIALVTLDQEDGRTLIHLLPGAWNDEATPTGAVFIQVEHSVDEVYMLLCPGHSTPAADPAAKIEADVPPPPPRPQPDPKKDTVLKEARL